MQDDSGFLGQSKPAWDHVLCLTSLPHGELHFSHDTPTHLSRPHREHPLTWRGKGSTALLISDSLLGRLVPNLSSMSQSTHSIRWALFTISKVEFLYSITQLLADTRPCCPSGC